MVITGYFSDFSLLEIFHLLHEGGKTGKLTVQALPESRCRTASTFHFWLSRGRIVAAADQLDGIGLLSMVHQKGWLSDRVITKLLAHVLPKRAPIGSWLKQHGALTSQQLEQLFFEQVLQRIYAVTQFKDGKFQFSTQAALPIEEMTGLSLLTAEALLIGLRILQSENKLAFDPPRPTSALLVKQPQPNLRLNQIEQQVFSSADGATSLMAIADWLRLPIQKIQHVAFRLVQVSLVEETGAFVLLSPRSQQANRANTNRPDLERTTHIPQRKPQAVTV